MKSAVQRAYLIGGYDQVLPTDAAETNVGTCYNAGTTYSPCWSVGIFNESMSVPYLDISSYQEDPWNTYMWGWYVSPLLVSGNDVGSSAADEYIALYFIREDLCREINRRLHNSTDIPPVTYTGSAGRTTVIHEDDGTVATFVQPSSNQMNFPQEQGCLHDSGVIMYIDILKRQ